MRNMITGPSAGAIAQLAEDVGQALVRFAERVRREEAVPVADDEGAGRRLGKTQTRVLALPGLATESGMSSGEVAEQLGLAQGNAQRTLSSLTSIGLLQQVEGVRPNRWRATRRNKE